MYALHKFIFIHTYVFGVFASNVDYLPGIHALDPFVFYIPGHGPFQYIYLFIYFCFCFYIRIYVYVCPTYIYIYTDLAFGGVRVFLLAASHSCVLTGD